MIEGFGTHGLGYKAIELFGLMLEERIKPNSVTFLSLLIACGHSGLVREGCKVYNSMKWIFGIQQDWIITLAWFWVDMEGLKRP